MAGSLEGSVECLCLGGRDKVRTHSTSSYSLCPESPGEARLDNVENETEFDVGSLVKVSPAEREVVQVAEGGGGDFPAVLQQQATRDAGARSDFVIRGLDIDGGLFQQVFPFDRLGGR